MNQKHRKMMSRYVTNPEEYELKLLYQCHSNLRELKKTRLMKPIDLREGIDELDEIKNICSSIIEKIRLLSELKNLI